MVKDNGIELFLDDLANRKPTPSGGSAAAVMGAIGAALVSMVCNLTIGKTQYRDFEEELKSVLTKAEELRRDCGIADRFERQPCFVERLLQHHERLRIEGAVVEGAHCSSLNRTMCVIRGSLDANLAKFVTSMPMT